MLKVKFLLILSILCLLKYSPAVSAAEEKLTITTYYPSPYGSYNELHVATALGIGTTSPGNKLTISTGLTGDDTLPALGSNGGKLGIFNQDSRYGLIGGVLSTGNVFLQAQRVDATPTAYNLLLQPNGGNVGIGTTEPTQKLEVAGNVYIPNNMLTVSGNTDQTGVITKGLSFGGTSPFIDAGLFYLGSVGGAANNKAGINMIIHGWDWGAEQKINFGRWTDGGRLIENAAIEASIGTGGNNNSYFNATGGNVGIGTTAPYTHTKLDVVSNGLDGNVIRLSNTGTNGHCRISVKTSCPSPWVALHTPINGFLLCVYCDSGS